MRQELTDLFIRYVRAPDHPGKLRIVNAIVRGFFRDVDFVVNTSYGLRLIVNFEDVSDRHIIFKNEYEPLTTRFMAKNILPGDKVVCAGVSFGLHTMLASRAAGELGTVIGVEPQPSSCARFMRNIGLNDLPNNVRIYAGALSGKAEEVDFSDVNRKNRGWSSLYSRDKERQSFKIHAENPNKIFENFGFIRPEFMLLDVEGHETEILSSLTKESMPSLLITEIHPYFIDVGCYNADEYYQLLHNLGYETFTLSGERAVSGTKLAEHNLVCISPDYARSVVWSD